MLGDKRIEHLFSRWKLLIIKHVQENPKFAGVSVEQPDFWGRKIALEFDILTDSPALFAPDSIAQFLETTFKFSAKNFVSGLQGMTNAFRLEQGNSPDTFLESTASDAYSQIFCRYCGICSTVSNSIMESLGDAKSASCIGHFQSEAHVLWSQQSKQPPDPASPDLPLPLPKLTHANVCTRPLSFSLERVQSQV
jgi:hypothetical protein